MLDNAKCGNIMIYEKSLKNFIKDLIYANDKLNTSLSKINLTKSLIYENSTKDIQINQILK